MLKVQAEKIRRLELKLAELAGANDLRSAEDRHTSAKPAEHQLAIAELRRWINAEQARLIDLPDVPQRRRPKLPRPLYGMKDVGTWILNLTMSAYRRLPPTEPASASVQSP
jgi:hypothetical protein